MKAVFILDDCRRNAEQLADYLRPADDFSCIVLDELGDFRRQARQFSSGVVLVELVQSSVNGFELAAALSRQSRFPVVLLSGREQPADTAWARARGIHFIFNRRHGLHALLQYIRCLLDGITPAQLTEALTRVAQLPASVQMATEDEPAPDDLNLAREQLRQLTAELWSELLTELEEAGTRTPERWQHLHAALGFLQIPLPADNLPAIVGLGQDLGADAPDKSLRYMLGRLCDQALQSGQPAWQELLQLVLVIQHLQAEGQDTVCMEVKAAAVAALYDPPVQPGNGAMQIDWQQVLVSTLERLPILEQRSLEQWHVSIYKLRSWLQHCIELMSADIPLLCWYRLIDVFYRVLSHLLVPLLPGSPRSELPVELRDAALHMQTNPTGLVVPDTLFISLVALDLAYSRQTGKTRLAEQYSLAAGLQLLSRPGKLVSRLIADTQQAGTLLAEVRHELQLLLEGARRWQVGNIESLVSLMLLCYRQLEQRHELLEQRQWRLVLGRAHRQLCRMLDQAAAWQTPDKKREAARTSRLLDELFLLLNPSEEQPARDDWQLCLRLNQRIRLLGDLQRREKLDCSMLVRALLGEQQILMQQHVALSQSV